MKKAFSKRHVVRDGKRLVSLCFHSWNPAVLKSLISPEKNHHKKFQDPVLINRYDAKKIDLCIFSEIIQIYPVLHTQEIAKARELMVKYNIKSNII